MTPNDTSEPGHLPAPVGPPPVAPPPGGLIHLILQYRFLIVSLKPACEYHHAITQAFSRLCGGGACL